MSFDDPPPGFAVCQACDAPATKTGNYEGKPVVLCLYHYRLLGKHWNFVEALDARAKKAKEKTR